MAEKKLVLNPKWCKGCGICVAFCPKKVLELKADKISLISREDCILCGLCELRCPDFAVHIEEVESNEKD